MPIPHTCSASYPAGPRDAWPRAANASPRVNAISHANSAMRRTPTLTVLNLRFGWGVSSARRLHRCMTRRVAGDLERSFRSTDFSNGFRSSTDGPGACVKRRKVSGLPTHSPRIWFP